MSELVIGVDVGGTFTDLVCSDGARSWRAKSPTEPSNFGDGVMAGLQLLADQMALDVSVMANRIGRFGLGTTAVTNVIATQKGRRVGLLTTAGFENHLRAARGRRERKDGWLQMPWSPVDEANVVGIEERIDRTGAVVSPLRDDDVLAAAAHLTSSGLVDAFAVSFLWSSKNPAHEQRAAELLRNRYPETPIFTGYDLVPMPREFERTTAAVLNAFCAGALDGVDDLAQRLRDLGMRPPLLLIHASGGSVTVDQARRTPLGLASSGPAAGAVAAASILASLEIEDAICCDMGGTSIDVAMIEDGAPVERHRGEVGGIFMAQSAIDVESVGAGGGSMAWIDKRNMLRVGPQSARARPGPVCYGRGGTVPTVTDAMVLLGYVDPASFLGGAIKLDVEGARDACGTLGAEIGMSAMDIAWGIREIALAEMSRTVRARLATSGRDPRGLAIVSYGGSGSLFTTAIAEHVGVPRVVVPKVASVFSAFGAAVANLRRERIEAVDRLLPCDAGEIATRMSSLRDAVSQDLESDCVDEGRRRLTILGDFRFYRQKWEISLPLVATAFDAEASIAAFQGAYADRYGSGAVSSGAPVELVALRAIGEGETIRAVLPADIGSTERGRRDPDASRTIYSGNQGYTDVEVHFADEIKVGEFIVGPALIDAVDTTIWIPGGKEARVNAQGTFLVETICD